MRKTYLVVAAAGLLLALGGTAEAKSPGAGLGSGPPTPGSLPSGLSKQDTKEPLGWDKGTQGNGDAWKQDTTGSTSTTDPLPPGLTKH